MNYKITSAPESGLKSLKITLSRVSSECLIENNSMETPRRLTRSTASQAKTPITRSAAKSSNLSLVKKSIVKTSTPGTGRKSKRFDSSKLHLALENCSLNHVSPKKSSDKSSDSSQSFQTAKENSPSKLNVTFNTSNESVTFNTNNESAIELDSFEQDSAELDHIEIPTLSKSAFDLQENYEELEELPDQCDYRSVKLKENVFIGYEEQKESLNFLIKTAIGRGESGTVLVFGGPGSGKTSFVNTCLNQSDLASSCRILRLNGLLHGNDVPTIHQIASFFDLDVSDLPRLMDRVKADCKRKTANIIVVLDEFEVFCSKNQFLLYNFFDLLQYVPNILVIGITSRYDCIELLEKRVKSRMNHKTLVLKPPFQNLGEYLDFARQLLDREIKFTKQFQQNLEIQYSKSYSIAQLKMCLLKNMRSKKAIETVRGPVRTYLTGRDEKVSLISHYLTDLEISVLLLAANLVCVKEMERFNCNALTARINEIPKQLGITVKLLQMTVGILIGYDLIVIEEPKSLQGKKLWLTQWTPLVLNVFKFQIEESLKRMKGKLSTDIDLLFTKQRS